MSKLRASNATLTWALGACKHTPASMQIISRCLLLWLVTGIFFSAADSLPASGAPRVLVFTRNQVGQGLYIHDNIATATAAIEKLGREHGFQVDVTQDPNTFSSSNLKRYRAIIFNNTNNEILDTEEQKTALQEFIHNGGGFVGIHSASGSMRKWPWFWSLLGGKFKRHPKLQPFTVRVKDLADPSTAHLPREFVWTDEFYYLDNLAFGLHVLLAGGLKQRDDPQQDT